MNIKAIGYTIVFSIVVIFFWFVYNLYKDNKILELNNAKLQTSIEAQQRVIEQQKLDIEQKQKIQNNYNSVITELKNKNEDLNKKFNKIKNIKVIVDNKETQIKKTRDIGKLAISKPKMIQNIINKGTIKEFKCLEIITDPNNRGTELCN